MFSLTYADRLYFHTTGFFTYIPQYSSKIKEMRGDTGANWLRYVLFSRKNIPQILVTSYAFIDVNNKIGLFKEKQRQISLINVIKNRYFQSVNVIKLGSFNTPVIYLLTTIL